MTDLYQHIGSKIRDLRLKHEQGTMSQETLGEKLGVASNTVSRWETGTYKPTAEDLDKLARLFSVSITVFFSSTLGASTFFVSTFFSSVFLGSPFFVSSSRYCSTRRMK